jgi:hypothetical protein
MIKQLRPDTNDDPDFIHSVNNNIDRLLVHNSPKDVYIIRVANWFDHKWLNFSGRGVVKFGWTSDIFCRYDSSLDEFSQDKITFPPFTPKRILLQRYFSRNQHGDYIEIWQNAVNSPQSKFQNRYGDYIEARPPELPHKRILQSSCSNLHRRVSQLSASGVFVWYSSNTLLNRRGSLMAYISKSEQVDTWFASFEKTQNWKIHLTRGIDKAFIQATLSNPLVQSA